MRIAKCKLQSGVLAGITLLLGTAGAAGLQSGPQAGERPLPFTSTMVTGPQRGRQHCYVCELKDEPAVLVFARRTDAATGRLLRVLSDTAREHRSEKLFGWVVFLGAEDTASQTDLERRAYELARQNGAAALPISVLGDPQGPPGYRIAPDAAATVILFRSGKVLHNRAYRAKEWNEKAAESALRELPRLLESASSGRS